MLLTQSARFNTKLTLGGPTSVNLHIPSLFTRHSFIHPYIRPCIGYWIPASLITICLTVLPVFYSTFTVVMHVTELVAPPVE